MRLITNKNQTCEGVELLHKNFANEYCTLSEVVCIISIKNNRKKKK